MKLKLQNSGWGKKSIYLKLSSAITNSVFLFTILAPVAMASEQAEKDKVIRAQIEAQNQIENAIRNMSAEERVQLKQEWMNSLDRDIKTLKNFLGKPAEYKQYLISQLDQVEQNVRDSKAQKADDTEVKKYSIEADASLKKFYEVRDSLINGSNNPDPDQAYAKLVDLRMKLQSLGALTVLKCIAASLASVVLVLGGVVVGATVCLVGVALCATGIGIIAGVPLFLIGAGLCAGGGLATMAVWDWAVND